MSTEPALWRALDLDSAETPVVAIVGGGGKTSLLYRLGEEAVALGRAAILAGTTRFTPRPVAGLETTIIERADASIVDAARAALSGERPLVLHAGDASKGRLQPITTEVADALAGLAGLGLLALEADGSKMLPFKAPADHEPVIPSTATHVVAVVGARAIDAPLDEEHVHRPERVRAIVGDVPRCSAEVIARVLADERGGRKGVGERAYSVVVNQADEDPIAAGRLAQALIEARAQRVVVASLRDRERPVWAAYAS